MQYNNSYPHGHDNRQPYPSPASHNARPPPNHHHPLGYAEQSNSHQVNPYPTTNTLVQGEYMEPHMNTAQAHQYSPYPPQGPAIPRDDHRSYFTSQGSGLENFPSSHSPTHSYLPGAVDPQSSRSTSRPPQHFISTPSQAYNQSHSHSPSTVSQGSTQRRPSIDPYYHMSPNPQHLSHVATAHGGRSSSSGTQPGPQHSHSQSHSSSASGERYPCDLCERTFTRSHDRRRHYETVHSAAPVLHKCRYCQKDFSRADSLKRHVDNGCDEMPSHR
ncbi:hypothetical protein EDC04DRAFT_2702174 [Pisolithus marmoratus]|nr:hypothetical protein EDC04DRAFT_2702174 [Pisolithus marmoratus]